MISTLNGNKAFWNETAKTSSGFGRQRKVSIESCQTKVTVVLIRHLINWIMSLIILYMKLIQA